MKNKVIIFSEKIFYIALKSKFKLPGSTPLRPSLPSSINRICMEMKYSTQRLIEEFVVKTAIVHFFEIKIKYDSKGKFHAENDDNISFLGKRSKNKKTRTLRVAVW